jgi:hypothetical protein
MLTDSSPLPPRGVFVPTSMLFHSQLPSAVLLTWIQLRALAWKGWSTPPLSLPELASLLGIHPSRLEKHLAHLQSAFALSLRTNASGKLVISFPEQPGSKPAPSASPLELVAAQLPATPTPDTSQSTSYFPHQILGYITYPGEEEIAVRQDAPQRTGSQAAKLSLNLDPLLSLSYQDLT